MDLFREAGQVNCGTYTGRGVRRMLAVGIDQSTRSPCILASPTIEQDQLAQTIQTNPFEFLAGPDELALGHIGEHLQLSKLDTTVDALRQVVRDLVSIFYGKEAFLLTTHLVECLGAIRAVSAHFSFDDAACNSSRQQGVLQDEVTAANGPRSDAERSGIVYIRLRGDGPVGALVNKARLAMNTVDSLQGKAANFLDTGGKATSETVKRGFELILEDPRVRVIFVNIFGELTLGDMIAKGVILASKELPLKIPVVFRIRGKNEKDGQQLIADTGLPLYAFDDFIWRQPRRSSYL